VRLDVAAEIIGPDHPGFAPGVRLLCRRYPQYRELGLAEGFSGLVVLRPRRGVAWHASGKSWSADLVGSGGTAQKHGQPVRGPGEVGNGE
jgi:hypothetical protein